MKIVKLLFVIFTVTLLPTIFTSNKFLSENGEFNLADNLKKYSRKSLEKFALFASTYEQQKRKTIGRWQLPFAKYINVIPDDKLIAYVVHIADQYPELKVEGKLEFLADVSQVLKSGTYKEYLATVEIGLLKQMALAAEKYARKKQGKESMRGGLHDYIDSLSRENIVDIIVDYVDAYPELQENRLLETLAGGETRDPEEIKEALNLVDRETLIHWVITCDEFDREKHPRLGGLHDYAFTLSKEKLIQLLINFFEQYPELTKNGRLQNLAGEYKDMNPGIFGGLLDYLNDFNQVEYVALAIAADEYDKAQRKIRVLGGLHDYAHTLNETQLSKIIKDIIAVYPELQVGGKLEELAKISKGGFIGYMRTMTDDDLRRVCIKIESYINKKEHREVDGGIHDYVDRLNTEDLISYIKEQTNKFTELRTKEKIEELLKSN